MLAYGSEVVNAVFICGVEFGPARRGPLKRHREFPRQPPLGASRGATNHQLPRRPAREARTSHR